MILHLDTARFSHIPLSLKTSTHLLVLFTHTFLAACLTRFPAYNLQIVVFQKRMFLEMRLSDNDIPLCLNINNLISLKYINF